VTAPPILSVEHLTTVFDLASGPAPAVIDVGFDLFPGQTLGIVGESGSGKSVTAYSILRLVQPPGRVAGGRVWFQGRDLLQLSDREMRSVRGAGIGFVFQEPMAALNPVMTVGRQIAEALEVHGRSGDSRRRTIELLDAVQIADSRHRVDEYPHQLSGGMRQRVMIAIALACQPSLVIADEPTTSLDVTIQAEILDLLKRMKQDLGLALVLITHDLGVVAGTADNVVVMYAGRVVERGPTRDLLRNPQHPYTRALVESLPRSGHGARLRSIEGAVPAIGAVPSGCAFHPRCRDRFEPCSTAVPPEYSLGPGRSAACYLHDPAVTVARALVDATD
jgi:oligopeptide/dipeptide ABC transporter ATP-binding protein